MGHEIKQVGRNCLADFLGGKSPAAILAALTFEKIVRDCGDEDSGFGGHAHHVFSPLAVLATTAASVRLNGWISKKVAAEKEGVASTAGHVTYLLTPPSGRDPKWSKAVTEFAPTADDSAKATGALDWAKSLAGATDYERNLSLIAKQTAVKPSHLGLLCSAIAGYERFLGTTTKKVATGPSEYLGTVGEKLTVDVTVTAVFDVDTQYGTLHINKLRDAAGNCLIWKTTSVRFDVGATKRLCGKVKRHEEFRDEKQTELTRCSEVDPNAVVPVKAARKSRAKKAKPDPVGELVADLGPALDVGYFKDTGRVTLIEERKSA